jgi:hypothetical protein
MRSHLGSAFVNLTRTSAISLGLVVLLLATGTWLWSRHARAWDLGRSSSVLGYDAAQYALAARELAEHGRLATTFALPLELARHPSPPWPLALVQPGLVAVEAVLFRIAGAADGVGVGGSADPGDARRLEWLVLALPLACFLATALLVAFAVSRILSRHAPGLTPLARAAAGAVVGLSFLLDPEAQHFAAGGFTELPFTLGLIAALSAIALESAPRRPFLFGLLLGVTGWFRGNMLWLAPVLAAAAAAPAPRGRRARAFALALSGYGLLLAPWWIYKWRAFGSTAWDLSWISVWDGVRGQTWFSLNHLPSLPELPTGRVAVAAIAGKTVRNLPALLLALTTGPRAAWLAALVIWALGTRPPRALAAAALAAFGLVVMSVVAAAASVPITRYLFPARIVGECAGMLALWGLIARAPAGWLGDSGRRTLCVMLAALAIGWGALRSAHGSAEARATVLQRGVPSAPAMTDLASRLDQELAPGEPVMSNLGPVLAWYARRPVVHLALSPADVDACRQRLDLRHVLLVFRQPARAWPPWVEVLQHPDEAARNPDWGIARARRFATRDGFLVVWLELGPLRTRMAAVAGPR